ncbi:jg8151 [Pararge aegeria aegeria]|uniref:Jg8151 protein n=1 Tax=Pararge aegeria aegeria TaxID=348720 RepID=A0A8S4SLI8_9NEOP|nr:jg8151 [Pararge aegeria aegeria]
MKKPVAYSLPPLKEKPKAGAALRGRRSRTTRTRRSADAVVAVSSAREPDVVVDAVDMAYIAGRCSENPIDL